VVACLRMVKESICLSRRRVTSLWMFRNGQLAWVQPRTDRRTRMSRAWQHALGA
jgi:hypothetical protein